MKELQKPASVSRRIPDEDASFEEAKFIDLMKSKRQSTAKEKLNNSFRSWLMATIFLFQVEHCFKRSLSVRDCGL